MSFISYSQNFEDVLLWRALGHVERGTYLDIGAQDPVHDSVSFAFYNAGWRGMHVEPTPFYAERLRDARPDELVIQAAVSSCAGPIEFHEFPETGLSTGRSAIAQRHVEHGFTQRLLKVPTVRLSSLLEQIGEVQWLKIDVEGMEADVLLSWDDCPVRPWVLVIEATAPSTQEQTHHEWEQQASDRGYTEVHFDGLSRFFLHSAHQELEERLRPCPNVFDAFNITDRHFAAGLLVESAAQESAAAHEQNVALAERAQTAEHRLIALEQEHAAAEAQRAQLKEALQDAHEAAAAADSRAQTLAAERVAALHELAAAEARHRCSAEKFAQSLESAQAELRDAALARVADQQEHRRLALEAQKQLHEAGRWRAAAEVAGAELQREKLRWEKQEEAAQVELGSLRDQLERQKGTFTDERTTLESEVARLKGVEEQFIDLTTTASLLQQQVLEANRTVANALAQPASRWQRLGQALGFSPEDAARSALRLWQTSPTSPTVASRELEMNLAPATEAGNPYLRANSLSELLSWHDVDFVRCAYVTVLGRQPDPAGEAYYTERVRQGRSKHEVLWDLRRSREGKRHDPGIAGFDRALKSAASARGRFVGALVRLLRKGDHETDACSLVRALSNREAVHHLEIMRSLSTTIEQLASLSQEMTRIKHGSTLFESEVDANMHFNSEHGGRGEHQSDLIGEAVNNAEVPALLPVSKRLLLRLNSPTHRRH